MHPHVLLVGGSSSVGKTTVSRAIGTRLGWEVVSAHRVLPDDAVLNPLAGAMEVWDKPPQVLCQLLVRAALVATSPLATKVEEFLSVGQGVVLEGERIHPRLVAQFSGVAEVQGVFVIETDSRRLYNNLMARSMSFRGLDARRRHAVAEVDRLYGAWLSEEGARLGLHCVSSQPWEGLAQRIFPSLADVVGMSSN